MTKAGQKLVYSWSSKLTPFYSSSFHMINRLKTVALITPLSLDSQGCTLLVLISPLDSQTKFCFLRYVQIPKFASILFSKMISTTRLSSQVTHLHTQFSNPSKLNTIGRSNSITCGSELTDHITLTWRKAEESGIFRFSARVRLLRNQLLLFTQMNGCS